MNQEVTIPNRKTFLKTFKMKRRQLDKESFVVPSDRLKYVIGVGQSSASEAIGDVWKYILQKNLFDSLNKRVEADEALRGLFFGRQVVKKRDVARFVIINMNPAGEQGENRMQLGRYRRGSIVTGSASLPGKHSTDLPPEEDDLEEEVEA